LFIHFFQRISGTRPLVSINYIKVKQPQNATLPFPD